MDSIAFFAAWHEYADTKETFLKELNVIQRKVKILHKNFEVTNILHKCFKS